VLLRRGGTMENRSFQGKMWKVIFVLFLIAPGFAYPQEKVLDITWRGFARHFTLENFVPDANGWIQIPYLGKGSIVMEKFPYPSGTYRIKLGTEVDKKGFASTLNLYINSEKVDSIKLNKDTGGGADYEFKETGINQGDKLTIEGVNDGDEFVRLSRLQIIKEAEVKLASAAAKEPKEVAPSTGNIIRNGNFENIKDGQPVDWTFFSAPQNVRINREGENHYILLDNRKDGVSTVLEQKLEKPLYSDREYILSFKGRVEDTERTVICVMVTNANWGPSDTQYLSHSPEWKEYRLRFKPKSVYDRVLIRVARGKAVFAVDDIKISEVVSGQPSSVLPGDITGQFLILKKKSNIVEVENSYLKATITSSGGKISELQTDGYNWTFGPSENWATGLSKLWISEDTAKELLTAEYKITIPEESKEKVRVATSYTTRDFLKGLTLEKEYTFFSDKPCIHVKTTIVNQTGKNLSFTPRINSYLNIWKTMDDNHPFFRVFISEKKRPVQLSLVPRLGETVKRGDKNSLWAGVIDIRTKNGILFLLEHEGPDEWMVWSGFEMSKGTLEMCYGTVSLKNRERWQVSYYIFSTHTLPSYGYATKDVIASVGEPDIYLYFPDNLDKAEIKLQTETGGVYEYYKEKIGAGYSFHIPLSSILDPGKGNLTIKARDKETKVGEIPRNTDILPAAIVSRTDKPERYLPLTVKAPPAPGKDGFLYYASDYYQHEIFASPDVPSMIAFGQVSNLPESKPVPDIRLVLDLPSGFRIYGGRFISTPIESTSVEIDNKKYERFRINISYGKHRSRSGVTELIVSTNLKAPQTLKAYYATEIGGKLYYQREIALHIISVPHVGTPQKIFTALWTLWGVLDDYPDITAFNKIGFASPSPEYFQRVIKSGVLAKSEIARGFAKFTAREDDAMCVDINGRRKKEGLACPTYRGKDYYNLLEEGKKAIDVGVYEHGFDPERRDGKEICFCERCLSHFREYLQKVSSLPYKDPKEFMRTPSQYPDYHKLWLIFKLEKESEKYRNYRDAMLNYMREKNLNPDRFKMFLAAQPNWRDKNRWSDTVEESLQDPLILKDIFDYYAPMVYIDINGRFRMTADMLEVPEEIGGLYQYSKGKLHVYPVLSVGFPYTDFIGNMEPNGMMKYQILEAFASGAKGFFLYSEGWFDALRMKYVAEAMKQIMPVEEIIATGQPTGRVKSLDGNVFVKGIESEKGAVILVSEYSEFPKESIVEYKVNEKSLVVNLETMEDVGVLTSENNTFRVKLGRERAILFFIGDKTNLKHL